MNLAVLMWDLEALHGDRCVRDVQLAQRGATGLSLDIYIVYRMYIISPCRTHGRRLHQENM
jgi:hypothetical protein